MAERKTDDRAVEAYVVNHSALGPVNGKGPWRQGDVLLHLHFTEHGEGTADHTAQTERLLKLGAIRPATDEEAKRAKDRWDLAEDEAPPPPYLTTGGDNPATHHWDEQSVQEREALARTRPITEPMSVTVVAAGEPGPAETGSRTPERGGRT